jgi:hypothetical protein
MTHHVLTDLTDDVLRCIAAFLRFLNPLSASCRRCHGCFSLWRVRTNLVGADALPRLLRVLPRVRRLQVPRHDGVGILAWCAAETAPFLEDLSLSVRQCPVVLPAVMGRVFRALGRLFRDAGRLGTLCLSLRIPPRLPTADWNGMLDDLPYALSNLQLQLHVIDPMTYLSATHPLGPRRRPRLRGAAAPYEASA